MSKGESLKDTALTLEAMGADAVVVRHWASGGAYRLAHAGWIRSAVVNAGRRDARASDAGAAGRVHACAAGSGSLEGRQIGIVGDVLHSRVARSNVQLLATLGAEVTLVAPPTLMPFAVEGWPCSYSYELDPVLPKLDAVMMLRVQRERMDQAFFPTEREYSPALRPARQADGGPARARRS